jgi:hypothetical protein
MKHNSLKFHFLTGKMVLLAAAFSALTLLNSCDDDDPEMEEAPELITTVTLTFIPSDESDPVIAVYTDPDGDGIQPPVISPINLTAGKSYVLTIELINALDPTDIEDITEEIEEEAEDHLFFFSWTNNVFSDPAGNGNVDERADLVNYVDFDDDGLPVGLETEWTAVSASASGVFRVVLKHQPLVKSATSTIDDGDTDIDISFPITID